MGACCTRRALVALLGARSTVMDLTCVLGGGGGIWAVGVEATRFCGVPTGLGASGTFVLSPGLGGRGGAVWCVLFEALTGSRALTGGRAGSIGRCSPLSWGVIWPLATPLASSLSLLLFANVW